MFGRRTRRQGLGYVLDVALSPRAACRSLAFVNLAQYAPCPREHRPESGRRLHPHGEGEGPRARRHLPARLAQRDVAAVTIAGLQFRQILAGAVLVETVFAWPGLSTLAYESILRRDHPVVPGNSLPLLCPRHPRQPRHGSLVSLDRSGDRDGKGLRHAQRRRYMTGGEPAPRSPGKAAPGSPNPIMRRPGEAGSFRPQPPRGGRTCGLWSHRHLSIAGPMVYGVDPFAIAGSPMLRPGEEGFPSAPTTSRTCSPAFWEEPRQPARRLLRRAHHDEHRRWHKARSPASTAAGSITS